MSTRKTHHAGKRRFLATLAATGAAATLPMGARAQSADAVWDLIVVGGGNSGLPAAIFAAARGARVLIIEAAGQIGGTLFLSSGQMSAGGTKLQKSKGIEDSGQLHYDDIMRISKGTANKDLVRLAVFNAADTFDWLTDNGFQAKPEHPVTGTTHEPYSRARYAWGAKGGISILEVLEKQIQPHIDAGRIKVLTATEATDLIQDAGGAVTGVVAKGEDGVSTRHMGRNVLLSCGGYASNSKMFEELEGVPDYSDVSYPYSQGAGITLGTKAGGYVRGGEHHLPLFGAIPRDEDFPAPTAAMARHFPGDRPPWEIFVNVDGKRFLAEDILSHDAYEHGLRDQPHERAWAIFDEEILSKAPPLVSRWTPQEVRDAVGTYNFFYRADTIAELARAAGVDEKNLVATVEAYNRAQAGKAKDSFGRTHMPLPIAKPPFYAIRTQSWQLSTYAGLAVDKDLRVIRQDGAPIQNLYACGELLGTSVFMGASYCGGMLVTPALTFGRLLGQKMLKFDV
ncbi:MAG: FAD-dependent oxidoreductase [Rhodospirillaceae bacterium]|nr:FAD-dependent oxidoreductase [Rhodospirillaceae bacterium]